MQTITYWSFSEKADRAFIEMSNKTWGFSAESDGKVGREIAQESLPSREQSTAQSAASYQCAKDRYDSKHQEFQQAEQQAILAYQSGNTKAGNLAMRKAIAIQLILPELALQLRQAEQVLKSDRKLMLSAKE
jgi:phage shock protein A